MPLPLLRTFLAVLLSAALAGALAAAVRPAAVFTSHAVLQQGRPVPVWGTADVGEKVTVRFAGQTVATTAGADGRWRVDLAPLAASATGRPLVIAGTNTVTLEDVLVGEVWLASGQSNMAWDLARTFDGALDAGTAGAFPGIRELLVKRTVAQGPVADVVSEAGWQVAGPTTAPKFSAVAFYFARELNLRLGVPVGIVHSSWGGTNVESWMSPAALAADPAGPAVATRWTQILADYPETERKHQEAVAAWESARAAAREAGREFTTSSPRPPLGPQNPNRPNSLYHAMIHGLAPLALQGALWYQGESNASRFEEYRTLFPALIRDWRRHFADEDLDFYWVQLASYRASLADRREWAFLREAQSGALTLPRTGEAVILDLGNFSDIHPRNKLDVGRRLARLALHRTYGLPLADRGPVLASAQREKDGFRLTFAATDGGLFTPDAELGGFEIAGEDRDFHPATAVIEKDTVFVRADAVAQPVAVRYAWRNASVASLFNQEGLPAAPFRTDRW